MTCYLQFMTFVSGIERQEAGSLPTPVRWSFLTTHAQVLLAVAQDPESRLRDIAGRVGITERAAHRIVGDLVDAGYLERERVGRRNRYAVNHDLAPPDALLREQRVGELLALLVGTPHPGGERPDA